MQNSCPIHTFDVSYDEAKNIQRGIADLLDCSPDSFSADDVGCIGGVDVAFINRPVGDNGKKSVEALAGIVLFDVEHGRIVDQTWAVAPVFFPYVPGFLSFREGPAVLRAIGTLSTLPDMFMYDGCGIAHPRGVGLASHMSVLTGIPSVGCAKSRLCGSCEEPSPEKGSWTDIMYKDAVVGTCLRTRDRVKPVYISPGNGVGIDAAKDIVLKCARRYRLPEPTRLAHKFVTAQKQRILRGS